MSRPIVRSCDQAYRNGSRRFQDTTLELRILIVSNLAGAHWVYPRDHHDGVVGRELYDLPWCEQRTRRFLTANHQVAKPWRETMTGIVLHRAHLGRCAECIRYTLGSAFIVGREGNPDMAIVENCVVRPVSTFELIATLGTQMSDLLAPISKSTTRP